MKKFSWVILFMSTILAVIAFGIWLSFQDTTPVMKDIEADTVPSVELVFMNSWGGVDGRADALQQLLDDFMRMNPDITVKNESIYGDEFLPSIKTRFALGNEPDVFGLWPGSDIRSLIAAGKVANLTDLLNDDPQFKSNFNDKMWQYVTDNGKIYGLPVEIIFEALFVNKNVFDLYDVKIPETYDELLTAIKVFKIHNIIPIAYNSEPEGSYIYQNLAMMMGSKPEIEQPFHDGQVNSCYIDAMYKMQELYDLGAFPENYFTLTSEERNNLFINRKAAMIVQGSWFISNFVTDPTVDLIAFPTLEKKNDGCPSMIYGMGCGIFYASQKSMDDSKKQQAVVKLIKFLASRQSAAYLAEDNGLISNVNVVDYHIMYNRLTQKGLGYVYFSKALIGPPDSFFTRSVWESVIINQFPYMLEKQITPEELWHEAIVSGAQEQ